MRYKFGEVAIQDALEAGPREFQVFVALCFHADERGYIEFRQDDLGARLGCGRQTIGKCLESLEVQGFLTRTTRYGGRDHADLTAVQIRHPLSAIFGTFSSPIQLDSPAPAKATRKPREKSISQRRSRGTSKPAGKK